MKPAIEALAERIARLAHAGQFRRDGITPYITHPERVAQRARDRTDGNSLVVAAAWLHDVIEDTDQTFNSLRGVGISDEVVEAVVLLTKDDGVAYEEYLHRIKTNEIAREVKIADMLDNLSDSPTDAQITKYARGLLALTAPGEFES